MADEFRSASLEAERTAPIADRLPLRPELGPAMIRAWCLARVFEDCFGNGRTGVRRIPRDSRGI